MPAITRGNTCRTLDFVNSLSWKTRIAPEVNFVKAVVHTCSSDQSLRKSPVDVVHMTSLYFNSLVAEIVFQEKNPYGGRNILAERTPAWVIASSVWSISDIVVFLENAIDRVWLNAWIPMLCFSASISFTNEGYFFTASPLMKNVPLILCVCNISSTIGVATGCGPSSKVRKISGDSIFQRIEGKRNWWILLVWDDIDVI